MPEPPEPPPGGFPDPPEAVRGAVLFGLTSWNPLGQEAPLEENLKSYRSLRADLQGLEPRPRAMWESFGFDASGYRENGFTVAFDEEVAAAARKAVVAVANKYRQGAVYEFRLGPPGSGRLVRSTVPALLQEVGADTVMVVCPSKPDLGPPSDPDLHFEAH